MITNPIQRGLDFTLFGTGGVYRVLEAEGVPEVVRPEDRPFFCAFPGPALALVDMAEE
jgi:hypothetical protein